MLSFFFFGHELARVADHPALSGVTRFMTHPPRGLAFKCSSGRVIKVKEAICWRNIEGRPCFAQSHSSLPCRLVDVVVVPIAPSVKEKRDRAEQQTDIKEDESALSELDVSACKTYGPRILLAANRALAALSEAGLAVGFDVNPRVRAAQKFEKWERRGLRVRLEIGLREADSDTVSIRVAHQKSFLVFHIFTIFHVLMSYYSASVSFTA
jgi:hypothetical protein